MKPISIEDRRIWHEHVDNKPVFTEKEWDLAAEIRRNYNKPVYNPLQIFPQGRKIMVQLYKEELKHWREQKQPYDIGDWFGEWQWEVCTEKIEELCKKIKILSAKGSKKSFRSQEDRLLAAKQIPILDIMGIKDNNSRTQFVPCPFHNEKNPSLHIYKETNTWYCFGCTKRGDSVDMYSKLNHVDFNTAIKQLS